MVLLGTAPQNARFGGGDLVEGEATLGLQVWDLERAGLGSGTFRFGIWDSSVWDLGPIGLGSGTCRFGLWDL